MAKRKKKKKTKIDPQDVLCERVRLSALELVRMIHHVNPTNKNLTPQKNEQRYRLKSGLQSLLIRRFGESLRIKADAMHPEVVSIRLKQFSEDACHAIISELDEDARSWIQRQIDEHVMRSNPSSNEQISETQKGNSATPYNPFLQKNKNNADDDSNNDNLPVHILIQKGLDAFAEYDYEACETYYTQSFKRSNGSLEATLALFEFLVDHMAAYESVIRLSETVSKDAAKNPDVKTYVALAAARMDDISRALEWIGNIVTPQALEVYLLAAKHFVEDKNEERTKEMLSLLKASQQAGIRPEVDTIEQKLRELQENRLRPLETEMLQAKERGEKDSATKLAQKLLGKWPQNKAAQEILNEFERQARDASVKKLLLEAEKAHNKNNYHKEVALLSRAIENGADSNLLADRLEHAIDLKQQQKEALENIHIIEQWNTGNVRESLIAYYRLTKKQQMHIRCEIYAPQFFWLSKLLASHKIIKPEKAVDAVLTLGNVQTSLQNGDVSQHMISELEAYTKLLWQLPETKQILQQIDALRHRDQITSAALELYKAGSYLAIDELYEASDCLHDLNQSVLANADIAFLKKLNQAIAKTERKKRLKQEYLDAANRKDHLTGQKIALQIAETEDRITAELWHERAEDHADIIKKEWAFFQGDITELPICYGMIDINRYMEDAKYCLMANEDEMLFVSAHENRLFIRTFSFAAQRFETGILLRTPTVILCSHIVCFEEILYIIDNMGGLLGINMITFDIVEWHDLNQLFNNGTNFEDIYFFPKSRTVWFYQNMSIQDDNELITIIQIDQKRTVKTLKTNGMPSIFNTGEDYNIAIQHFDSGKISIYSERGKVIYTISCDPYELLTKAAIHPNGNDYLLFTYDDEDDNKLKVRILSPNKKKDVLLNISDSNGQFQHTVHLCRKTGLLFIHFIKAVSEERAYLLSCYRINEDGFEFVYQTELPESLIIATDEHLTKVAAMGSDGRKLKMIFLDEHEPDIIALSLDKRSFDNLPKFDYPFFCDKPTGQLNEMALKFADKFKHSIANEQLMVNALKKEHQSDPDTLAAVHYALKLRFDYDEAEAFMEWFMKKHPTHYWVRYTQSCDAAEEKDWPRVVSLLEHLPFEDFDDGTARHACHLLGMAYFTQGDYEHALHVWKKGDSYEDGSCCLAPYIDYAELSLMSRKDRKECKVLSDLHKTLQIFETIDEYRAEHNWLKAIEFMEEKHVPSCNILQITARLTDAYLRLSEDDADYNDEMRRICKTIALSHYITIYHENFTNKIKYFPPFIDALSEIQLKHLLDKANEWLNHRDIR